MIVIWYKNSTVIKESSDTRITFDGSTARLSISKCKVSHSATYKVVMKNEFGEDESAALLTVEEKPEEKVIEVNHLVDSSIPIKLICCAFVNMCIFTVP